MPFDGTVNCWNPDWPLEIKRKPRLTIAEFGDGYEQRILDSINWMDVDYNLKWTMRPRTILTAMNQYLTDIQAGSFAFYNPTTQVTEQVFCDEWTLTWAYKGRKADYGDLQATFRRAQGSGTLAALPAMSIVK